MASLTPRVAFDRVLYIGRVEVLAVAEDDQVAGPSIVLPQPFLSPQRLACWPYLLPYRVRTPQVLRRLPLQVWEDLVDDSVLFVPGHTVEEHLIQVDCPAFEHRAAL